MSDNIRYFDYDNPKDFLDKMKELDSLLGKNGFPLFLYGGTLLGCIREENFIVHDDDIDLFYISKQSHRKAVLNEFENIIRPLLENNGWTIQPISWRLQGVPKVMMGQYHVIKDNISIDLWTAWFNKKDEFSVTMTCENGPLMKTDMVPAKKGVLRGNLFNIPANSDKFLEHLYGPTWQTPDSKYKIPSNKNFLQKSMLKVIDQFGWAYFFIAKAQQKYSYHKITYKRLKDMNNYKIEEDVIYFHSPCMGNVEINTLINKYIDRKKTKIIGAYGGENAGIYTDADLIVTISFPFLKKLKELYPNKTCIFLPEAMDCSYFKNSDHTVDNFEVGYVGRPCRVKRMHLLDKLSFPVKTQTNWGKEFFTEDRTLDEVRNFYKTIDCLVLTSQSECMPRVVLEAMAMGLPVVSTDVGCIRMLLDPEWIVPNTSEEDIVKNMNDRLTILQKYPDIRQKVGIRNRQHIIKHFNWESTQQIWDDVINALVVSDYEKINKIGKNLEEKWEKLYQNYNPPTRTDLIDAPKIHEKPLRITNAPALETIYNVIPSVILLGKTCKDVILKKEDLGKTFDFGVRKNQLVNVTQYFLTHGFNQSLTNNVFTKDDYTVKLSIFEEKTKHFLYKNMATLVPFPVTGYLESLYGRRWATLDK